MTKKKGEPEGCFSLHCHAELVSDSQREGDKSLHLRHAGFSPASREEVAGMMSHYRDETPCRGTE
ncbi:MAG: hypothetical protein IJO11_06545 [Alphaproteobacteria bacterium]|nr:hypothetical protein [Alphaproteobacteria bacterium]